MREKWTFSEEKKIWLDLANGKSSRFSSRRSDPTWKVRYGINLSIVIFHIDELKKSLTHCTFIFLEDSYFRCF